MFHSLSVISSIITPVKHKDSQYRYYIIKIIKIVVRNVAERFISSLQVLVSLDFLFLQETSIIIIIIPFSLIKIRLVVIARSFHSLKQFFAIIITFIVHIACFNFPFVKISNVHMNFSEVLI